ncbi:MAG: GntR family transcriptional regulator [Desulfobacter sp.]|nr:GntR family transcriptional regulator [Desulfobacter sp.]WDP84884.1 MAG: GntR family transcriptional regulator [Desulfobacter sp.]
MKPRLNILSLREQVYEYLRTEMVTGILVPGSAINLNKIAQQLGISKTPLRDALIHLELEGFVTILPRRGVMVNALTLEDVKNAYDSIGIIEAAIVLDTYHRIKPAQITRLERLNQQMRKDIENDNFSNLFKTNLAFHDVINHLSDNPLLEKFILPIKHRLYDFQGQSYIPEWEMRNCDEHDQYIEFLKQKNPEAAAGVLKDIHWSYKVQESYIKQFYATSGNET